MTVDISRVAELEKTIETLVSYLRRLPVNPETYRHVKEAEAVLGKQGFSAALRGRKCLPSGIEILSAELNGLEVTVKTQDVGNLSESFQREHKIIFLMHLSEA